MSAMVWTMRDVLARKRRKDLVPRDAAPWWMRALAAFFWVAAIADLRTTGAPWWMSSETPPWLVTAVKASFVILPGLFLGVTVFILFFQLLSRRVMKELDKEPVSTRSAWRSEAKDWVVALFFFGTQRSWPIAVVGLLISLYYWLRTPGGDAS